MAVASFINRKLDTSEIVIAYAGTNTGGGLDNWTGIQTAIGGSKELDTSKPFETATPIDGQVITAEKIAENVKKDKFQVPVQGRIQSIHYNCIK